VKKLVTGTHFRKWVTVTNFAELRRSRRSAGIANGPEDRGRRS
jgi:hypothetical protein